MRHHIFGSSVVFVLSVPKLTPHNSSKETCRGQKDAFYTIFCIYAKTALVFDVHNIYAILPVVLTGAAGMTITFLPKFSAIQQE